MRILCISAQKPDSTGSGVYLAETVASMAAAGPCRSSTAAIITSAPAPNAWR